MTEPAPSQEKQTPIKVPSKGPNITSTLDLPANPTRLRTFMATVRKDWLAQHPKPQTG
jgi:hypothetical protein